MANHRYVEWLVRLLFLLAGSIGTAIGSWVASKIRVYDDSRKAHLDDIKDKVLTPLKDNLVENYGALVTHRSAVVTPEWGVRARKSELRSTEYPTEEGPLLARRAPNIRNAADAALYLDAKERHFPKIMIHIEHFLASWQAHADECYAWVMRLSEEILDKSQLPEQSGSIVPEYVRHYHLGVFIYRRLFHSLDRALFKRNQNPMGPASWIIEGVDGASALGSEQQIDAVLAVLDILMEREKSTADRLRENARALEKEFASLHAELNYAIAARRLPKRCNLVPFF